MAGTLFLPAPALSARSWAASAESRRVLTASETGAAVGGAASGATSPVVGADAAAAGGAMTLLVSGVGALGAYISKITTAASAASTPTRHFIGACVISFST